MQLARRGDPSGRTTKAQSNQVHEHPIAVCAGVRRRPGAGAGVVPGIRRRGRAARVAAWVARSAVVAWCALAPGDAAVRSAAALDLPGMRPAPRVLSEAEVAALLVRRLEAMRVRRAYLVERAAEREAAAVGEGRARPDERLPLPRNPEPVPGDEAVGVPE